MKIYIDSSVLAYVISETTTDLNAIFKKNISETILKNLKSDKNATVCTSKLAIYELLESGFSILDCSNIMSRYELLDLNDSCQDVCSLDYELVQETSLLNPFSIFHRAIAISNKVDVIVSWNMSQTCDYDAFKVISDAADQLKAQCPLVCTPLQLADLNGMCIDEVTDKLQSGIASSFEKFTYPSGEFSWSVVKCRRFIDSNIAKYITQEPIKSNRHHEDIDLSLLNVNELINNSHLALKKGEIYRIVWNKYKSENDSYKYSEIRDWILKQLPTGVNNFDVAHRSAIGVLQAAGIYKTTKERSEHSE